MARAPEPDAADRAGAGGSLGRGARVPAERRARRRRGRRGRDAARRPGGVECGRRIIVIDPKDGSVLQICDVGKEIPVGDVLLDIVMFGGFLFAVSRLSRLVALKGLWGRESEESARELCARVVV